MVDELMIPQNRINEFLILRANAQELNSYMYDIKDQLDRPGSEKAFDITLAKTRIHISGALTTTLLKHIQNVLEDERKNYLCEIANICGVSPQRIFITSDGQIGITP